MQKKIILESRIGLKLVQLGTLARVHAGQIFSEKNLSITPEQFTVLSTLVAENGLYARQISSITLKDRPNISRILKILEKAELITKKADVNKRKIYKVFITEKGKAIYEEALPVIISLWNQIMVDIDESTINLLIPALEKMKENLQDKVNMQI